MKKLHVAPSLPVVKDILSKYFVQRQIIQNLFTRCFLHLSAQQE